MKFSKSYHAQKRREKARQQARQATPYRVTVYDTETREAVEVKRFSSYESATEYANIYRNGGRLDAFID